MADTGTRQRFRSRPLLALRGLPSLWLVLWLWLAGPLSAQLNVDGVAIGMSYDQVLQAAGRPRAIGEKNGATYLRFPTPRSRPEGSCVWFLSDRVVFATGYSLYRDGEPLFLYGLEGILLEEEFGPAQILTAYARWWPESGIVLVGSNNLWPRDTLRAPLALRDPGFPVQWQEIQDGRWSKYEPWVDDETLAWLADDVELGMSQERARKLAGDLDVVYRGGFVQAVRNPPNALLSHRVGHHDFSVNFEVGLAPMGLGTLPLFPASGWWSPAPGGRVRMDDGKVAEIELCLANDRLFEALEKLP